MRIAVTFLVTMSAVTALQGCATTQQPGTAAQQFPRSAPGREPVAHRVSAGVAGYFGTGTSTTHGTVNVEGRTVQYRAVAGKIVVHGAGWRDAEAPDGKGEGGAVPEAAMFYVAYLEDGVKPDARPLTFVFNGGPGSSSLWQHVSGLGPRRVVTAGRSETAAASFHMESNEYSLLDASDLVFIDAPGTGFGRIRGKNAEKAFYGVDPDVHAFAEFITEFLSMYDRWNSPKYMVGEGYGAARAAALVNVLETRNNVDFNGVVLLSPVLNLELFGGVGALDPFNPGLDLPYELELPSFAAAAWYHDKLPGGREPLDALLVKVEHFAVTAYAQALRQGSLLTPADRAGVADQLHEYTGLPVSYIDKADLRIDDGEFEQALLGDAGTSIGQLDSRGSGPSLDPLSERGDYEDAAVKSACVSAFNHYVRQTLRYGFGMTYQPDVSIVGEWSFWHTPPGQTDPVQQWANVMPDLANAMKISPGLKIMVAGGYFDLAAPFMTGWYEMRHLQIPATLRGNIQYDYYRSGHLGLVPSPVLKQLHDNIAAWIDATDRSWDR